MSYSYTLGLVLIGVSAALFGAVGYLSRKNPDFRRLEADRGIRELEELLALEASVRPEG